MPKQRLKKTEIIKNETIIKGLLSSNNKIFSYPLLIKWEINPNDRAQQPVQVGIIVSKKRFNKAVNRNLIKRRIRESYRFNKNILQKVNKCLHLKILFIYVSNKIEKFQVIDNALQDALYNLISELKNDKFI